MAAAGTSGADTPSDSSRCAAKIDEKWSLAERFVWTQVCSGQPADFNHAKDFGGELAADKEQGWASAKRDVGAEFLEEVLSQKKYLDEIPQNFISIDGARFSNRTGTIISTVNVTSIEITNSRFDDTFAFDFANVANLFVIGKSVIDDLTFYALTAKNITIYDSHINRLDVRSSNVIHSISLQGINGGSISFEGGQIGNINIVGSRVSSMSVSQCTVDNDIGLFSGINGATNDIGDLSLLRTKVGGALYFSYGSGSLGTLTIKATTISDFYEPPNIPTHVVLDGFNFNSWFMREEAKDIAPTLQFLLVANYDPAIYLKLAASLNSEGRYAAAREVLYAKRSRDYPSSGRLEKLFNWISWGTVGYGQKPEIGLVLFAALFIVGYVAFRSGESLLAPGAVPRSWAIFTADTIIPFLSLDKASDNISFPDWRQWIVYILKLSGLILAYLVFKILQQYVDGTS
jgi:hypothetical protein